MELKEYQKKTLEQVKRYLEELAKFKAKNEKTIAIDPELSINYPLKAWEKVVGTSYQSKKNGLAEELPNFYLKIPTAGGKTLLACHTIDLINRTYLKKQTGIVLWVVPTTQIYRQTLISLKNREHSYRQVLDISSGGRTIILEKMDRFAKLDVAENLVVMLLMLPSASRQNKEVLKVFKDSGGFGEFFPSEDDRVGNENLLKEFPNLDCFGDVNGFYGRVVKTSLGNTLRVLKPIIIIDEGHKAYSEIAQKTIRNFNPSIIVELSATPPEMSNKLVTISGQELNREEMIKLDLHIINKASPDWKDAMLSAVEKRAFLEKRAEEYEANTGEHIRPICLIQAERTGKEQRGTKYIHAEDVKEYLVKQCGISEEEIAIKSSEKDDIEGIDLLSKDCPIRYIITKQALQEGWDCAFAYLLTILTNPSSQLSITQLVGRILRQPKARKTKVKELDESYVFCFRPKATELLENVRKGFGDEGLGDLAGRISVDEGDTDSIRATKERIVGYREKFKKFEGNVYLPKFVIQESGSWRDVNYEMDILSRIDWNKVNLEALNDISLSELRPQEQEVVVGLSEDVKELIKEKGRLSKEGGLEIDKVFITRQILDIIPNPWVAYDIGKKVIDMFLARYDEKTVTYNFVFIIEELRKLLEKEKDRLAEQVFRELIDRKVLCFFLLYSKGGYRLPSNIRVKSNSKALVRSDNSAIQRSLFSFVPEEELNEMEKSIAIYLDEQEKLLWWYRNLSRQDYYVQGWKKHKIYPDFVFTDINNKVQNDYDKVYIVETKGLHLKNEDTDYKKNIFTFCNKLGRQKDWRELNLEFAKKRIEFQVIFEDEWKKKINEIFGV
ncbi:DEAD/DEAH box helicase family protein [candidate division WOR-3 bacterium]|nr:DEAD/DEAH box helicase family protein [candidate division WOR-3 bacterium]